MELSFYVMQRNVSLQFKDKTRNYYYIDRVTTLDSFAAPSIVGGWGNMLLIGNSGSNGVLFSVLLLFLGASREV